MSDTSEASMIDDGAFDPKYVFGNLRNSSNSLPTLVVGVPTENGWRVRSTDRSYNHDYVSYETFEDVMSWLDIDLNRPFICRDREEAMCILETRESLTGFLLPGDCSCATEEVDKVLQHLECGWGVVSVSPMPA
jgi:hypothetical protein